MKFNEWIVVLNGTKIDCNGFYCGYSCVTAYSKKEALRILAKAKKYYFGSYKLNSIIQKNTYVKINSSSFKYYN
jgi:hypothetical protein